MAEEAAEVLVEEFEHDGEMRVLVCGDHKKMVIIDQMKKLQSCFQLCFVFVFGMDFVCGSERVNRIVACKENVN